MNLFLANCLLRVCVEWRLLEESAELFLLTAAVADEAWLLAAVADEAVRSDLLVELAPTEVELVVDESSPIVAGLFIELVLLLLLLLGDGWRGMGLTTSLGLQREHTPAAAVLSITRRMASHQLIFMSTLGARKIMWPPWPKSPHHSSFLSLYIRAIQNMLRHIFGIYIPLPNMHISIIFVQILA